MMVEVDFSVFFLTKLLPMLMYPVGMTWLLIALAAGISRRRPSIARSCCFVAFAVLFLAGNRWVSFALVEPLERSYSPLASPPTADAIVVLGGSVEAAFRPQQNVHLAHGDRLLFAAMLYHSHKAPLVFVSSGISPWPSSEPNEGESTSQALALMGVPPSAILEEPPSNNTYQEASAVKKLMTTHNLHRILLVTSAMHMPRALLTFRHQGIDSIPSPTEFAATEYDIARSHATFGRVALNLIPDAGVIGITTVALKEYIGLAYYWTRNWL
jgi:uncharacterized SAM-binding protein YcdF (DUF218 family)